MVQQDQIPISKGDISKLADAAVSERISAPSFRVFKGIADSLDLTVEQRAKLLGGISEATYHNWKSKSTLQLNRDQLERLSLILGIWKAIRLLFTDTERGISWLKAKNTDTPFSSHSPLETMLRGSIDDLYSVRRYLDAWRGVWP